MTRLLPCRFFSFWVMGRLVVRPDWQAVKTAPFWWRFAVVSARCNARFVTTSLDCRRDSCSARMHLMYWHLLVPDRHVLSAQISLPHSLSYDSCSAPLPSPVAKPTALLASLAVWRCQFKRLMPQFSAHHCIWNAMLRRNTQCSLSNEIRCTCRGHDTSSRASAASTSVTEVSAAPRVPARPKVIRWWHLQGSSHHDLTAFTCALYVFILLPFCSFPFPSGICVFLPCFHQKINPKMKTMKLNQSTITTLPIVNFISLFPCSHSLHTCKYFFGSSLTTPSNPLLMAHFIIYSSLTVHTMSGRLRCLVSRRKEAPRGPMRETDKRLKEMLGTFKNCRAYGMEKPMWVMGKVGRYLVQGGRNLA